MLNKFAVNFVVGCLSEPKDTDPALAMFNSPPLRSVLVEMSTMVVELLVVPS